MNKPYLVLGFHHPKVLKDTKSGAREVGEFLANFTASQGLVPHDDPEHGPLILKRSWYSIPLHAEVRRRTSNATSAEGFHYDGDDTPGANPHCLLVLWSSVKPTEIQYKGKIFTPNPWEVVVFRNFDTLHRRPENCPLHRWTFRQRCALPVFGSELDEMIP